MNFELYQAAIPKSNIRYEELYGKAVAPMLQMMDSFPDEMKPLPFRFYFDNLFTGIPLLSNFKYLGYGGTGTVRQNHVPKECPITKSDVMKKAKQGTYEYAYCK